MNLDVQTLLVLMLTNVFTVALALPAIMGWRVSPGARCMQGSVIAQALGWASFLSARYVNDRWLSTLCMALLGASFVLMWHALDEWLGPRPGRRLIWAAAVLTPIGYGLGFDSYAFRVGWSNFGLALQMAVVCVALARPAAQASRRWRALVLGCLAALAVVTLWRGVLGAFFTEAYPYYRAPHPINILGAVLNHVCLVLTTMGFLVAWHEEAERELRKQANQDSLTGLLNRRAFTERAADLLALARRYNDHLTVLMIDIDYFKQINDRAGHAAGDRALQLMGQALQTCMRRGDLACRYGGEEFCVLLVRAGAASAAEFDRRLRRVVRELTAGDEPAALNFSTGVATRRADEQALEPLIERADQALYQAKAQGRGRLVREASAPSALDLEV
jgi:diguanylate cyclase (GGDEF)-like protein